MQRNDNISNLMLEQFVLDELPADARARVTERLQHDVALQARLADLQQSDTKLRVAYPTDMVSRAILRRASLQPVRGRWQPWLGLAFTAVLIALVGGPALLRPGRSDDVQDRLKGDAAVLVVERIGSGDDAAKEALLSGDHGRQGDVLQLAVHAPVPAYLVVVSVDGRGHATQLLPQMGAKAWSTAGMASPYLPIQYTLDDAPAYERIFLVGSNAAFDADIVMAAARQLAGDSQAREVALPLTSELSQTSILILKD